MAENIGGPFGTKRVYNTPSGGDMEIGNPVINGTPYSKLFIDANRNLAQDSRFIFNPDAFNEVTGFNSSASAYLQPALSGFVGLNDVSVDTTGITINPSQLIVTIQSTNQYNYVENGVSYPTLITMGATHTTPNGAKIDFGSLTGYTPGDSFFFVCMRNRTLYQDGLIPLTDRFGWERSIAKTGQAISQRVEFDITTGNARSYETVEGGTQRYYDNAYYNGIKMLYSKKIEDVSTNIDSEIELRENGANLFSRNNATNEIGRIGTLSNNTLVQISNATQSTTQSVFLQSFVTTIDNGTSTTSVEQTFNDFKIDTGQKIRVTVPASAPYNVELNDFLVVATLGGDVNLPAITGDLDGKVYRFKCGASAVTINANGSDTIESSSTLAMSPGDKVTLVAVSSISMWLTI